jgi:hypothetical protein
LISLKNLLIKNLKIKVYIKLKVYRTKQQFVLNMSTGVAKSVLSKHIKKSWPMQKGPRKAEIGKKTGTQIG